MSFVTCLILSACLAVTSVVSAPVDGRACEMLSCGILLDCGSSSTKLKIYAWRQLSNSLGIPHISKVDFEGEDKFKPGMADFGDDQEGMNAYVSEIIEEAKKVIPSSAYKRTPIFAMATAGFRLLGLSGAKDGMFRLTQALLNESVNPFLFKKGQATVISGEEEGVYTWLAANYVGDFFNTPKPNPRDAVGIMEMGGGSTQIAFVPRDPLMAEEFQVVVRGRPYSLYVQSYLKFGLTAIQEKVAAQLYRTNQSHKLLNPCYLRGDVQNITLDSGEEVELYGTGDAEECKGVYSNILASAPPEDCNMPPCAIGTVFQPCVDGIEFYATSAFKYPIKGVNFTDPKLDIPGLWEKTMAYCRTMYIDVEEGDRKYASSNCNGAVYIYSLLTGPYNFPEDTQKVMVSSERNGEDIDWALGAMLEYIPWSFTGNRQLVAAIAKRK